MKKLAILTILMLTACIDPGAGYESIQPDSVQPDLLSVCLEVKEFECIKWKLIEIDPTDPA